MWLKIAQNAWKWLEMAGTTGNGWKWLKTAKHDGK